MNSIHCWIHDIDEDIPDDVYRVCFECSHVFATPESLVIAYNEDIPELNKQIQTSILVKTLADVDSISFCPECLHDF